MRLIALLLLSGLLSGCFCITEHSSAYSTPAGLYAGTCSCATALSIPFRHSNSAEGNWAKAYATIMFPCFLIDLPFEIVADTCTFPYDLAVKLMED